jgi:hypothetical protein
MATHIVFDSTTEVEPEPDNDSDDAPFQPANQPPAGQVIVNPADGSDPIALDHGLTPSNDATEGQQIAQAVTNDDGVSKSYVETPNADGTMSIYMSDANGNETHEINVGADGSSVQDMTFAPDGTVTDSSVWQLGDESSGTIPPDAITLLAMMGQKRVWNSTIMMVGPRS